MKAGRRAWVVTLAVPAFLGVAQGEMLLPASEALPARRCSLDEYQSHLKGLAKLVAECARDATRQSCDAARVGPDDDVATADGPRHVGYAWLRSVLENAGNSIGAKDQRKAQSEAAALLEEARLRLEEEQAPKSPRVPVRTRDLTMARSALSSILSRSEFVHVTSQRGFVKRAISALFEWIGRRLISAASYSSHAHWIARLFLIAVNVGACTALIWWFVAQSRRQRLALFSSLGSVLQSSPSARGWQRWFEEAEQLSNAGRWREAVHRIYWAAIAQMESRGLWPADLARTPREYLAFLQPGSANRTDLTALTRTFERVWYGHYPAGEPEYARACVLLERLASR